MSSRFFALPASMAFFNGDANCRVKPRGQMLEQHCIIQLNTNSNARDQKSKKLHIMDQSTAQTNTKAVPNNQQYCSYEGTGTVG
eukprot:scaffold5529_cov117-Cylindrotheca_fusiformis.AAC.4